MRRNSPVNGIRCGGWSTNENEYRAADDIMSTTSEEFPRTSQEKTLEINALPSRGIIFILQRSVEMVSPDRVMNHFPESSFSVTVLLNTSCKLKECSKPIHSSRQQANEIFGWSYTCLFTHPSRFVLSRVWINAEEANPLELKTIIRLSVLHCSLHESIATYVQGIRVAVAQETIRYFVGVLGILMDEPVWRALTIGSN